jgi:hypothetical protein
LPEGSVGIFVFPIGVFPKLPDKRLPLFLISSLLPIRNDLLLQHLLTNLPLKLLFCAQLEVSKQHYISQLLFYVKDFLKDVKNTLEVFLVKRLLIHCTAERTLLY